MNAAFHSRLRQGSSRGPCARAFTLVELLVVIAIIGILATLLMPALRLARVSAEKAACISNLRQLYMANAIYATDYGEFVPAAEDMFGSNRTRWHGKRGAGNAFDARRGPLAPYLGSGKEIRRCRAFDDLQAGEAEDAFEKSCGGYGYNSVGVGSQIYIYGLTAQAMTHGMAPESIQKPSFTVMFADCALPQPYGPNPDSLIEYSFAEPCRWVFQSGKESSAFPLPSIHFRHGGQANVVWCDGHVSSETMSPWVKSGAAEIGIGWFGPPDNTYFDPY